MDPLCFLPQLGLERRFQYGEVTEPVTTTAVFVQTSIIVMNADIKSRWPRLKYKTVFVKEGYLNSPKAKLQTAMLPSKINAAVDQAIYGLVDECYEQMPSAKSVVSDDRLKRHGLWLPGKPHATDAVRHLVVRLRMLS